MIRLSACGAAVLVITLNAAIANAALLGSSVTGALKFSAGSTNFFDPVNNDVPATGFLNSAGTTVTIAEPQIEFGYKDNFDTNSANFTAGELFIKDQIAATGGFSSATLTFTDAVFAGGSITPVADNYPNALGATLVGNTITITRPSSTLISGQTYTAEFTLVTPEPAALTMLVLPLCALLRRSRPR